MVAISVEFSADALHDAQHYAISLSETIFFYGAISRTISLYPSELYPSELYLTIPPEWPRAPKLRQLKKYLLVMKKYQEIKLPDLPVVFGK